jgi:hypothetical protein
LGLSTVAKPLHGAPKVPPAEVVHGHLVQVRVPGCLFGSSFAVAWQFFSVVPRWCRAGVHGHLVQVRLLGLLPCGCALLQAASVHMR